MRTVIINGRRVPGASCPLVRYPGAELWTNGRNFVPDWPWTAHYDLHPVEWADYHPGIVNDRPDAWIWYARQRGDGPPIWLLDAHEDIPASRRFPRESVQAWARGFDSETEFRTSIDWMIARALWEGFDRLVLHNVGANVTHNTTWRAQHGAGIAYWIAAARFLGRRLLVEGNSIFTAPTRVYGYEDGGLRYATRSRRAHR